MSQQSDQLSIERNVDGMVVRRASIMCFILSFANFAYIFTSHQFIKLYWDSASLADNALLRFGASIVPYLLFGTFLKKSKFAASKKIKMFIWFYGFMFACAAMIFVWPIAILKDPSILLYVGSINSAYLCAVLVVVSIPKRYLVHTLLSVSIFIFAPLLFIVCYTKNLSLGTIVLNDTAFAAICGIALGCMGDKLYQNLEKLRLQQIAMTSQFIDQRVIQKILKNDVKILEEKVIKTFVLFTDIRMSTQHTRKYKEHWHEFTKRWFNEAAEAINSHHGTIIKTAGDSLLVSFGLFDDEVDLSDIPTLAQKIEEADDFKWRQLSQDILKCINALESTFLRLTNEFFPQDSIKLGIGVDKGSVTRGVRRTSSRVEFDIWGDVVNTAAKLESYTKQFMQLHPEAGVLTVLSPFACDHMDVDFTQMKKYPVKDNELQNGIRWVTIIANSSIRTKQAA